MSTVHPKTIVFFDGSCPLCRKEIAHYSALDRSGKCDWRDLNKEREMLDALGISYIEAMRQLHVLDKNVHLKKGVSAFITIWSELPGYRWLAAIVRLVGASPALEHLYARFAAARMRQRMRCMPINEPAARAALCHENH